MRHQPVVVIASICSLGLALSELYRYFPTGATLLIAGCGLFGLGLGRRGHALYALLLVSVLYGQYRAGQVPVDHALHLLNREVTLTLTVDSLPTVEPGRVRFLARAVQAETAEGPVPVSGRLAVSRALAAGETWRPMPGDRVTAKAKLLEITHLGNPGGFDYAAFMARQGIFLRAVIGRGQVTDRPADPAPLLPRLRQRVMDVARQNLPPDAAALLVAITIGDTSAIHWPMNENFQGSGVAHLLSISGTHLGLLATLVFFGVRAIAWLLPYPFLLFVTRRFTLRAVAGGCAFLAITVYTMLSGWLLPTFRSWLMVLVVMLALLLRRRTDGYNALALAALVILAIDPNALGLASFQLSFTAVLAILLVLSSDAALHPPARVPRAVWDALLVTCAAGAATAPLVAYDFGQVTWAGFAANLVLVPLMGILILPASLLFAALAPFPGAVAALSAPLAPLLAWFLDATAWFAHLPGALRHVAAPPGALVIATYAAATLFVLGWRHICWRAVVSGLLVLLPAWGASLFPAPPTGELHVTFLDVGQGEATVITGPDGSTLVIDAGTRLGDFDMGRLVVAPWLWQNGISRIHMVVTHPQLDHEGGIPYLAGHFRLRSAHTGGDTAPESRIDSEVQQALSREGHPPVTMVRGDTLPILPGVTLNVLNPDIAGRPSTPRNDRSVVLRLAYGEHTFLFTGDIEAKAETALLGSGHPLAAQVLQVPHHGSRSSSTPPFLAAVAPQIAVISAGARNPYRHPHPVIVARYQSLAIPLHETARAGAALFASDGHRLEYVSARTLALTPVAAAVGFGTAWREERDNWLRLWHPRALWRAIATPPG